MLQRHLGHHLCDLFQRAGSSRKGNKYIPQFDHLRLPFCHILRDDQLRDLIILVFHINEKLWLHPDDFSTCLQHALRQFSHEAGFGTSVDQAVATLSNPGAEFPHRHFQCRIFSFICSQIHCNVHACSPFFPCFLCV